MHGSDTPASPRLRARARNPPRRVPSTGARRPQRAPAGEIGQHLGVRQNTVCRSPCGSCIRPVSCDRREGRRFAISADMDGVRGLMGFLLEDCCGGRPSRRPVLDEIACLLKGTMTDPNAVPMQRELRPLDHCAEAILNRRARLVPWHSRREPSRGSVTPCDRNARAARPRHRLRPVEGLGRVRRLDAPARWTSSSRSATRRRPVRSGPDTQGPRIGVSPTPLPPRARPSRRRRRRLPATLEPHLALDRAADRVARQAGPRAADPRSAAPRRTPTPDALQPLAPARAEAPRHRDASRSGGSGIMADR